MSELDSLSAASIFSTTKFNYNLSLPLIQHVYAAANKTPYQTALITSQKKISYSELVEKVQQYVHILTIEAIKKDDIVCVYLPRSIESIAAQLAIFHLGALYLPVDTTSSQQRITLMLDIAKPTCIIYSSLLAKPSFSKFKRIDIANIKSTPIKSIPVEKFNDNLYIVFTSGSTGLPKGVIGSHQGMLNRLFWYLRNYPFESNECICHKTKLGFIDSITELLPGLLSNIPLVIASDEEVLQTDLLLDLISQYGVSRITLVPSLLEQLIKQDSHHTLESLKQIILSGETLHDKIIKKFYSNYTKPVLLNLYGSSEISGDVSFYEIHHNTLSSKFSCIGTAIDNCELHIVKDNNVITTSSPGELCVSGVALANGYLHNSEYQHQKFKTIYHEGKYINVFHTGDLCQWNSNKYLDFLGRIDNQIKILGNIINTDEIENTIKNYPDVSECIVVPVSSKSNSIKLNAYYTVRTELVENIKSAETDDLFTKQLDDRNDDFLRQYQKQDNPFQYIHHLLLSNAEKHHNLIQWLKKNQFTTLLEIAPSMESISLAMPDDLNLKMITYMSSPQVCRIFSNVASYLKRHHTSFTWCYPHRMDFSLFQDIELILINTLADAFITLYQLDDFLNKIISTTKNPIIYLSNIIDAQPILTLSDAYVFKTPNKKMSPLNEAAYKMQIANERLAISPEFFLQLKNKIPSISHVDFIPSQSSNKFTEYDVILHINKNSIPTDKIHYKESEYSGTYNSMMLFNYLEKHLPFFMLPSNLVRVNEIPLLWNGKKDRKKVASIKHLGKFTNSKQCIDRIQYHISRIWSSVFQCHFIDPDVTFMSLGGNSLNKVELISAIEEKFNIQLPIAWLHSHNTISKQANEIRKKKHDDFSYQPIILFNNKGDTPPLIMIHPALIGAEAYADFALNLDRKIICFGIDSYNLYNAIPKQSIQELAEYYCDKIINYFNCKSIYLGGWSLGAIISYELASLLFLKGIEVKEIYMIDPGEPTFVFQEGLQFVTENELDFLSNLPEHIKDYIKLLPNNIAKRILTNIKIELEMMMRYRPSNSNHILKIFMATHLLKSSLVGKQSDLFTAWSRYTPNIKIHPISANHFSIMNANSIKQICRQINTCILGLSS